MSDQGPQASLTPHMHQRALGVLPCRQFATVHVLDHVKVDNDQCRQRVYLRSCGF